MTSRTTLAKKQDRDMKLSPEQRKAEFLAPRRKTGFDVCLQPSASRVYAGRGWVRTV